MSDAELASGPGKFDPVANTKPLPERSIRRPIEDEEYFQKEDHIAFSPVQGQLGIESLVLALLLAKLGKTAEGQKSLERIAVKYLDSCARIIEAVQDASHSNWLTALNNQHIAAAICHRIGLIDDGAYIRIMRHYRAVFDKMLALNLVQDTISGVTTLVQGTKIGTGETGTGQSGLAALANIIGAKR